MSFERLAGFFRQQFDDSKNSQEDQQRAIRLATAVVLLEIAYADESISRQEEDKLFAHLKKTFALNEDEVRDLIESAEETRAKTIDHWSVTNFLKKNLTLEQRIDIVKSMWKIVYSDGQLHQYENYLVRKLADLLGLEHHVMIAAKLAAKQES